MLLIQNIRKSGICLGGLSGSRAEPLLWFQSQKNRPEGSCLISLTWLFRPVAHRELALSKVHVKNGNASTEDFEEENWPLGHNVCICGLNAGSLDPLCLAPDVNSAASSHRLDPHFLLSSALLTAIVSVGLSMAPQGVSPVFSPLHLTPVFAPPAAIPLARAPL